MNRLFRPSNSRVGGYTALAVFVAAYLAALALVLAPGAIFGVVP